MFGWRRRRDGFEWREYVRTTILVRRKKRRDRVEEVGKAAVDGLARASRAGAAAGKSGAAAAQREIGKAGRQAGGFGLAAGRWASHNARKARAAAGPLGRSAAMAAGRAGSAAGRRSAEAARAAGSALARGARWGGAHASTLFAGLGGKLRAPLGVVATRQTAMPLAVAGAAALLGALTRVFTQGFDATALIAALIAVALLGLAALPFAADHFKWPARLAMPRLQTASLPSLPRLRPWAFGVIGAALIGALVAWIPLGWVSLPSFQVADAVPNVWGSDEVVAGYAVSLTGDSMRIDGKIVQLADIEAPELTQTCARSDGGTWNCGQAALNGLRRLTGNHTITCDVQHTDASGRRVGKCRFGETDLAAEMVRQGLVFASGSLFPAYGSEQSEAQAAKAGLWGGTAVSPREYRDERWQAASRDAPDGCPIKGRVLASGKVYLLPWSRSYESYSVRESRGDRWFCKEDEALSEGWKPYDS